jgi:hypothetical protein
MRDIDAKKIHRITHVKKSNKVIDKRSMQYAAKGADISNKVLLSAIASMFKCETVAEAKRAYRKTVMKKMSNIRKYVNPYAY